MEIGHLLVISHDEDLARSVRRYLRDWATFHMTQLVPPPTDTINEDPELRAAIARADAVILETQPGAPAVAAALVETCRSAAPFAPVLVIDRLGDADASVRAMRAGASDCLRPGQISAKSLRRALGNAMEKAGIQHQLHLRDLLLDSIEECVFTVDRSWRITTMNRAGETLLGVKREDAIGRTCCEVIGHSLCSEGCPLLTSVFAGQSSEARVVRRRDDLGREVPLSVKATPLRDASGQVIGGLSTLRDLTPVENVRKAARERHAFADMIGKSEPMRALFASLPAVARSGSTVLIEGPSGTGKELVARALHGLSERAEGPFVPVSCAALPDELLESELFGYRAGAFTGALRDKPGRFAAAEGGTLFLDEIGDITPGMQTRLLRVLQERAYEPLGSNEPVRADVRIVAATHRDLEAAVRAGRFRQDLYYRLRVVRLDLPSLRERIVDLPLLAQAFLEECCLLQGKSIFGFTEAAMVKLLEHDFPGNVRELRNAVEHAVTICDRQLIDVAHLPRELRSAGLAGALGRTPGRDSLKQMERAYLEQLLRKHGGSRVAVARELGVHPTTVYRKIRSLGADVPETDGRSRAAGQH
jgi:PAS domain S-box-containing protein